MPRLTALDVADEPAAWQRAGFSVDADGGCRIGGVRLRLGAGDGGGITGWALADLPSGTTEVDGLPTGSVHGPPPPPADHPNGVSAIDHVVVTTPDLDRTVAALEAVGAEARRRRDASTGERRIHQVFFWLGDTILEVVGPPEPAGGGRARFFGIALTTADLDATSALLGEHLGAPKDAVQPGRRIATLRRSTGVRTAVAFLSPHPG
jgi:hypothetical protein